MEAIKKHSGLSFKLLAVCLGLVLVSLFLAPQKAEAAFEDGSTYPPDVKNALDYFCWWGNSEGRNQRAASVTWASAAGNVSQTNIVITQGQHSVYVEFHTITKRCHQNDEIDALTSNFIPWSGEFINQSNGQVTPIPSFTEGGGLSRDARMIVNPSPQPPGPLYSRESKTVSMSTAGITSTTTFTFRVISKQYADRWVYPFTYGGQRYPCVPSIDDILNGTGPVLTAPTGDAQLCSSVEVSNDITVVVPGQQSSASFTATCDTLNVTATDADYAPGPEWTLEFDYGTSNYRSFNGRGTQSNVSLANYKDAYQHDVTLVKYDSNSAGATINGSGVRLPAQRIGPCAPPTCNNSVVIPGGVPDPGTRFNAAFGFDYSRGGSGRELTYNFSVTPRAGGANVTGGDNRTATSQVTPPNSYTVNNFVAQNEGAVIFDWTISWSGGTISCNNAGSPPSVSSKPYFKVYGGDIVAGSAFITTSMCDLNETASIKAFSSQDSSGQWRGASSQFAAHALGTIEGFYSANMRGGPGVAGDAKPVNGLSFGNYASSPPAAVPVDAAGKDPSGAARCIPDYYDFVSKMTRDAPSNDVTPGVADTVVSFYGSTTMATTPGQFANGWRYVLYHQGSDVTITGAGIDLGTGGWISAKAMPYFYLVVKDGSINIAPSVTRLDGVYVAQNGTIDTCFGGNVTTCSNTLTVNGAFIATNVKLNRTNGTVGKAVANEGANTTNIAEVFNFTPELYLARVSAGPQPSRIVNKYDSIVGLPPIL